MEQIQVDGFVRLFQSTPAFDKRSPNPNTNYGIHGLDLRWVLKGPAGAVQFVLYTNWQLPSVRAERKLRDHSMDYCPNEPMPADLGYHSRTPHYESQEPIAERCEYVDGPCYYDGSTLNAEPVFDILVSQGEEALWGRLREYYDNVFSSETANV